MRLRRKGRHYPPSDWVWNPMGLCARERKRCYTFQLAKLCFPLFVRFVGFGCFGFSHIAISFLVKRVLRASPTQREYIWSMLRHQCNKALTILLAGPIKKKGNFQHHWKVVYRRRLLVLCSLCHQIACDLTVLALLSVRTLSATDFVLRLHYPTILWIVFLHILGSVICSIARWHL
jgi:hypothetical protein